MVFLFCRRPVELKKNDKLERTFFKKFSSAQVPCTTKEILKVVICVCTSTTHTQQNPISATFCYDQPSWKVKGSKNGRKEHEIMTQIKRAVVTRMYHVFTNFPWGPNDDFVHILASQYAQTTLMYMHDWMIWSTVRTVLPKVTPGPPCQLPFKEN